MTISTAAGDVSTVELSVADSTAEGIADALSGPDGPFHVHLRCPALAASRNHVFKAASDHDTTVLWVTFNTQLVPDGAVHVYPSHVLNYDELDALVWTSDAAVVLDADALDSFDISDRLTAVANAKSIGRFIRLTRA